MRILLSKFAPEVETRTLDIKNPEFVEKMPYFIQRASELKSEVASISPIYLELVENYVNSGIGGSGVYAKILRHLTTIRCIVVGVPSPESCERIRNLPPKKSIKGLISRSGQTKEILAQFQFQDDIPMIAVTNGGILGDICEILEIPTIPVTEDVSGRFSVMNELGVVPMILMGLDPVAFLTELQKNYKTYFNGDSPAAIFAQRIIALESRGEYHRVIFSNTGESSEDLARLPLQLLNESYPKDPSVILSAHLHPMPDSAHSDAQRWYGGRHDGMFVSLRIDRSAKDTLGSFDPRIRDLIPGKGSVSALEHLNATTIAIEETFPGPIARICLEEMSISEVTAWIAFWHAVTYYMCEIKGFSYGDQPHVDAYKERTTKFYQSRS